ncbi:hypothetical protein Q5P01_002013 [Channa striata]|uniref:Uncharacterized protein n=1 Tax=Channa striata TaxID=64152 RepID=A0AA88NNE8_CHASR|nr:hypothetical protein Q5P01_002013 [Channa striata]
MLSCRWFSSDRTGKVPQADGEPVKGCTAANQPRPGGVNPGADGRQLQVEVVLDGLCYEVLQSSNSVFSLEVCDSQCFS